MKNLGHYNGKDIQIKYSCNFVTVFFYCLQVTLAIRGGYIPEISQTANKKTRILGLKYVNLD